MLLQVSAVVYNWGVMKQFGKENQTRKSEKFIKTLNYTYSSCTILCPNIVQYSLILYYRRTLKTVLQPLNFVSKSRFYFFCLIFWQAPIPPPFWMPQYRHFSFNSFFKCFTFFKCQIFLYAKLKVLQE